MTTITTEILWVTNLLRELSCPLHVPPTIYCDNIGATYLYANPIFHSHMKHIEVNFHFVRNQVTKNLLCVQHVHATDQLADSPTKPLSCQRLHQQLKIGVHDGTPILQGQNRQLM